MINKTLQGLQRAAGSTQLARIATQAVRALRKRPAEAQDGPPADPPPAAPEAVQDEPEAGLPFVDPSRYLMIEAIGQLVPEGWTWTATSVATTRVESGSRTAVRLRFESGKADVDQSWGLVVDMAGDGETITELRVLRGPSGREEDAGREYYVNMRLPDAPGDHDLAAVRYEVAKALAQLPGVPFDVAVRKVAARVVSAALEALRGDARAAVEGMRETPAAIVLAVEDRSLLAAAVEALGNRLRLRINSKAATPKRSERDLDRDSRKKRAPAILLSCDDMTKSETSEFPRKVAAAIARNESAVMTCTSPGRLPPALRRMADATVNVRMLAESFGACFEAAFGVPPPEPLGDDDARWARLVTLDDFRAALRGTTSPEAAFARIRQLARRRTRSSSVENARPLSGLHGLGDAAAWARTTINEMRLAAAGKLSWDAVDRGVLLVGPPGCGKTALARAVALESGMPLISASAASWQAAGHLGDLLKAMRGDFEEARRLAPSFLFIDEIDAIGNREQFAGHNKQYMVEVVNGLLEQLDGYQQREGVIALAATSHLGNVDPALFRPGRLDRVVWIALPDVPALAAIYREYLGDAAALDVDCEELARLSDGWSGAQVEFIVRCARRLARERGDATVKMADLRTEAIRLLIGGSGDPPVGEAARRIAVHEAGHALVRLLGPDGGKGVAFVSILPRGQSGGLAIHLPTEIGHSTRDDMIGRIRVTLGGRAAEEVVYGRDGVSLGAGGGATSDLATATRFAIMLEQSFGTGSERPLLWLPPPATPEDAARALRTDPELAERVSALLDREYRVAVESIAGRRDLLDRVVELLLAEREVDGRKLRALVTR